MGMHTNVVGVKPPDEKWKQMKAVYDTCYAAGMDPPQEVQKFFGFEEPDEDGVVIDKQALLRCGAIKPHADDGEEGFVLDVKKIPADVTIIRFVNSW